MIAKEYRVTLKMKFRYDVDHNFLNKVLDAMRYTYNDNVVQADEVEMRLVGLEEIEEK